MLEFRLMRWIIEVHPDDEDYEGFSLLDEEKFSPAALWRHDLAVTDITLTTWDLCHHSSVITSHSS